jgi:hypothetical protein
MKVSELFRDVVTQGGGTPVQTCSCGKTYFADGDKACYDPGEKEDLERQASEKPEKYISSSNDCIAFACFGGQTFVWECEDCPVMSKYETFIWTERRRIIEYIKRRTEQELSDAKENAELLEGVKR